MCAITPYQMAVNNVVNFMGKYNTETKTILDAFNASVVLGAAFCKDKEDIMSDIIEAHMSLKND